MNRVSIKQEQDREKKRGIRRERMEREEELGERGFIQKKADGDVGVKLERIKISGRDGDVMVGQACNCGIHRAPTEQQRLHLLN